MFTGGLAVKDSTLSLLWHAFDPGSGSFGYPRLNQKEKIFLKKYKKDDQKEMFWRLLKELSGAQDECLT